MKLLGMTAIVAACQLVQCSGTTPAVAVRDATVAVKDAVCLLTTYSTEVQAGVNEVQAGIDAIAKCGVPTDVAQNLLAAHKAGLQREARKTP